jgi:riboflavin biosynthesis pyrimidine reductase
VHALLAANLVDAISIFMVPVVLGRGRLFADVSRAKRKWLGRRA